MNPIYTAYYSHEGQDCYKIDLPWTRYRKDTMVLCPVSQGYDCAKNLAIGVIQKHLMEAMKEEVRDSDCSTDPQHNHPLPVRVRRRDGLFGGQYWMELTETGGEYVYRSGYRVPSSWTISTPLLQEFLKTGTWVTF